MLLVSRRSKGLRARIGTITLRTYTQDLQVEAVVDPIATAPTFKKHKHRHDAAPFPFRWPGWNLVVGIEVHAQLKTRRKLFSDSLVPEDSFVPPNERVSLFDAAFPGTLPVSGLFLVSRSIEAAKSINPVCVKLAARTALALHADIQSRSSFDRKHYFYGDLPTGYQITQNYSPFAKGGYLELLKSGKRVRIKQIQIEQDTAKSNHVGDDTQLDLNRVGMPLLEIVSLPDISSAEEAGEYVRMLQAVLRSVCASDGMMEAGSLRCDVNVSIHKDKQPLGTRTELKNLNSIKNVVLAINVEAHRQLRILTSGDGPENERIVRQETLTFDEDNLLTRPLRAKEGVDDYRYMPDPNLPRLDIESDAIDALKKDMASQGMAGPVLTSGEVKFGWEGIKQRLEASLSASHKATPQKKRTDVGRELEVLMMLDAGKTVGWDGVPEPGAVSFFEQVTGTCTSEGTDELGQRRNPRVVLNWMIHDLLGQLTRRNETFSNNPLSPQELGEIIDAVEEGTITTTGGKVLLRHLLNVSRQTAMASSDPLLACLSAADSSLPKQAPSILDLINALGLAKSSSNLDLERWVQQVIHEFPEEVRRFRAGKRNVIMALVGRVMKLSQGSADAVQAKELLEKELNR